MQILDQIVSFFIPTIIGIIGVSSTVIIYVKKYMQFAKLKIPQSLIKLSLKDFNGQMVEIIWLLSMIFIFFNSTNNIGIRNTSDLLGELGPTNLRVSLGNEINLTNIEENTVIQVLVDDIVIPMVVNENKEIFIVNNDLPIQITRNSNIKYYLTINYTHPDVKVFKVHVDESVLSIQLFIWERYLEPSSVLPIFLSLFSLIMLALFLFEINKIVDSLKDEGFINTIAVPFVVLTLYYLFISTLLEVAVELVLVIGFILSSLALRKLRKKVMNISSDFFILDSEYVAVMESFDKKWICFKYSPLNHVSDTIEIHIDSFYLKEIIFDHKLNKLTDKCKVVYK